MELMSNQMEVQQIQSTANNFPWKPEKYVLGFMYVNFLNLAFVSLSLFLGTLCCSSFNYVKNWRTCFQTSTWKTYAFPQANVSRFFWNFYLILQCSGIRLGFHISIQKIILTFIVSSGEHWFSSKPAQFCKHKKDFLLIL